MKARDDLLMEARVIVAKVKTAVELGGGFNLYTALAPDVIVELVDAELRDILKRAEIAEDTDGSNAFVSNLIFDIKERLRP